jgi:hypothetical protein
MRAVWSIRWIGRLHVGLLVFGFRLSGDDAGVSFTVWWVLVPMGLEHMKQMTLRSGAWLPGVCGLSARRSGSEAVARTKDVQRFARQEEAVGLLT